MTVFDQIKQLLEHQAGVKPEDIKLESNLVDNLGLDDLDVVEFVMRVEQNFGISILDERVKLLTVEDFVNYRVSGNSLIKKKIKYLRYFSTKSNKFFCK